MRTVFLTLLCFWWAQNVSATAVDTTTGRTAPAKVSGDVQSLVNHLVDVMASDTAKANIIYNWVASNIALDIKAQKDPERGDPVIKGILADKKTVTEGYTLLYKEMCKAAGLECVIVKGYGKSWMFDNGDKFYLPNHEWCAVMIDRRWELVDPLMGAGGVHKAPGWFRTQLNRFTKEKIKYAKKEVFEFRYEPAYFMMDPLDFRFSHLPVDPLWQLAKTPMPLNVFEAGDSAIAYYNVQNEGRINRSPELEYMARLNEEQAIVEYADRAYKFNTHYDAILARKEAIKAYELISKNASRRHVPPRRNFEDAYRGMVLAEGYLKKQRSYMAPAYNELKKKNITKNKEANDYIRRIRTHGKSLSAQCKMHASSAERKVNSLDRKYDRAAFIKETISPLRIDSIKTTTIQKDKNSPALVALSDSIKAKQKRLKALNMDVIGSLQNITLLQEQNKELAERLAEARVLADTILVMQAEARLNFVDNYDDDMKTLMAMFEKARFTQTDTMQKRYLQNFDTLIVYYEGLLKQYQGQADLYKSSLRDMEQYRRWNNTEEFIVTSYGQACNKYSESMSQYTQTMEVYAKFLEDNRKMFEEWQKSYEDEDDLYERMEEGETARKEAEETAMNDDKTFDEKQNDKHQQSAAAALKELTEILSKE